MAGNREFPVPDFNVKTLTVTGNAAITGTLNSAGATVTTLAMTNTGQVYQYPAATGRAGATATVGYVNTGVDTITVTLAQNATADTWVIPITGLKEGDIITSIGVCGQIESGGNAATIDYDLKATTAVASGSTTAELQSGTQVSKTADYLVNETTAMGTPHTVIEGNVYFMIVTCTTAASTDVELLHIELTVTEK